MSLEQFQKRFHNEKACRSFLYKSRWPQGYCCPQCGHHLYYYVQTRNLYECQDCRMQTSLTAGTLFHRTKLPLKYWFLVIYLVSCGQHCTARWLTKTLQLNYRTSLRLLSVVRQAMREHNSIHPLSNIIKTEDEARTTEKKSHHKKKEPSTIEHKVISTIITRLHNKKTALETEVVTRAKHLMMQKVNQFIRKNYRNVQSKYLQDYIDEYYFRVLNLSGSQHIFSRIISICSSIHPTAFYFS